VHPTAYISTLAGVEIARDVRIAEHVYVGNGCVIGKNCIIVSAQEPTGGDAPPTATAPEIAPVGKPKGRQRGKASVADEEPAEALRPAGSLFSDDTEEGGSGREADGEEGGRGDAGLSGGEPEGPGRTAGCG
jgi:hypothetical protein